MNVEPPVYIQDKGSYTFFITDGVPYVVTIPWPSVDAPLDAYVQMGTTLFQSQLADFAEDFLKKTLDYFTTPLSQDSFLEELQHTWTDPYGLLRAARPPDSTSVQLQWVPVQVYLGLTTYELVWALHEQDPGYQEPSGGTVSREPEVVPREPSPTPASIEPSLQPVDLSEIPCVEDTPEQGEAESLSMLRARDRRLIRETRLQAELLQLRATRLTQRYLEKYVNATANAPIPDSDSVLSFPSDTE